MEPILSDENTLKGLFGWGDNTICRLYSASDISVVLAVCDVSLENISSNEGSCFDRRT